MILIDANILMYAAGAAHPHKAPSARLLERVARGEVAATINAKTLQEILHRYRVIKRRNDGRQVYDLARQLFRSVVPISAEIAPSCRALSTIASPTLMNVHDRMCPVVARAATPNAPLLSRAAFRYRVMHGRRFVFTSLCGAASARPMQRFDNGRRVVGSHLQQRKSRSIGRPASLLPVAQRCDADADHQGELRL